MTYSDDNIGEVVYEYIDKVLDDVIKYDGQHHEHIFDDILHLYIQNRVDTLSFMFRDVRVYAGNPINYFYAEPKPFNLTPNVNVSETIEIQTINVVYKNPKLYLDLEIDRSELRKVKKMVATGWGGFGYGRTVDEYTEVEDIEGGNINDPAGLKRRALREFKIRIAPELGPYLNRTTIFINSTNFELKL